VLATGVAVTVKLVLLIAVPPAVVKTIFPVAAPGITIATRLVPVFETMIAFTPPIVNTVGLAKLEPVMVTKDPTGPFEGVKEIKAGACPLHRMPRPKSNKASIILFIDIRDAPVVPTGIILYKENIF
jgi:hypothetical protein